MKKIIKKGYIDLENSPAVFAVENEYRIMKFADKPSLFCIRVGEYTFYDEKNGVMRSDCLVHSVCIPMKLLDKYEKYIVCETEMIERKPYFPVVGKCVETEYEFHPVRGGKIRIYHIADTHDTTDFPIASAKNFGKIDLLIMNGDIPNIGNTPENYKTIYKLASSITNGNLPIVFARGNHDLRGLYAEKISDFIPTRNGSTYYTFRLGEIWGMVLDCGEDKEDSYSEYGGTVCCHNFRIQETEWIKSVIKNKRREYRSKGIKYRIVIAHNPFTYIGAKPFDIEKKLYKQWVDLLKKYIKPHFIISGHLHRCFVSRRSDLYDTLGQPCPVIVGSQISDDSFVGCGLELDNKGIICAFYDNNGNLFGREKIR